MASIRKAKRRADKSKDRKINLPASKIGQAGKAVSNKDQSERPRYEVVLYDPSEIHTREPRQQVEPKAVVERQLGKLAGRESTNRTASNLEDARQRSAEWLSSESSKFKSSGVTVLFPEDLNNIRKIVKEEIKLAGGSGGVGFGLPIPGMGNKGGTPTPVPAPTGGKPPTKFPKLKVGGAMSVIGLALSVLEGISDNREIERKYRNTEIDKDERDRQENEVKYRIGGGLAGSAIGGAIGSLLGPGGWFLGSMAGGFIGRQVGSAFGSSPIKKAAQGIEQNTSIQKSDLEDAKKEHQKSSSDAIAAITKASEKFNISKDEMLAVAMQESSMNPNAKTKRSDAVGLFQFLPSTWNGLIKNNGDITKQYGIGAASVGGDDDRTDPFKSAVMYALLRKETTDALGKLTTGDSTVDVYIMHLLSGPIGKKVIKAFLDDPSSRINTHVRQNQYTANRELMEKNGSPLSVSEFVANVKVKLQTRSAEAKKVSEKYETPQATQSVEPPKQESTQMPLDSVANIAQGVDTSGLTKSTMASVAGLANDYYDATGDKLNINSAFRSSAKQEQLYKANPSKAAPPGTSTHELGMAIDANSSQLNKADQLGLLSKHKLSRPLRSEPWHLENENARSSMRKKSDTEDRMQFTNQMNRQLDAANTAPIVINKSSAAAPQPTQIQSPPAAANSLTTRNNDDTYQIFKLHEVARLQ